MHFAAQKQEKQSIWAERDYGENLEAVVTFSVQYLLVLRTLI